MEQVKIFTDGCCLGNPGRGGWSAILSDGVRKKEISGGFQLTTNNRMELMACVKGLEALLLSCKVAIISDSKYLVESINMGWAIKWRANNWMRNNKDKAQNADLWERLLESIALHEVSFYWVRGHSGHPMNERCDHLAQQAARGENLELDSGYTRDESDSWG